MAGLAFTFAATGTTLAAVTRRNDRRAATARAALTIGTVTLIAGAIGAVWFYFDVARI